MHASTRTTRAASPAAAEERFEHVAETATESGVAEPGATATALLQWIATEIDDAPLLRVREHLVCGRDLLATGLSSLVRVYIGVEFTGELAVCALDLLVGRLLTDPERCVVIPCHLSSLPSMSFQHPGGSSARRELLP